MKKKNKEKSLAIAKDNVQKSRKPKSFYDLIRENCYVAPLSTTSTLPRSTRSTECIFVSEQGEGVIEEDTLLQQHDWLDDAIQPPILPWKDLKSLASAKIERPARNNTSTTTSASASASASVDSESGLDLTVSDSSQLDSEEEAALVDYIQNVGLSDPGFQFSSPLQSLVLSDWEDTSESETSLSDQDDTSIDSDDQEDEEDDEEDKKKEAQSVSSEDDFDILMQEYQKIISRQKDGTYYERASYADLMTPIPKGQGLKARVKAMKKEKKRQSQVPQWQSESLTTTWANSPSMTTSKQPDRYPKIEFRELNREVKRFIQDESLQEYSLDPMNQFLRKTAHELACLYGLKSKSRGKGEQRFIVLYKTKRSTLPGKSGRTAVDRLIDRGNAMQHTSGYQRNLSVLDSKMGRKKVKSKHGGGRPSTESGGSFGARVVPGMVVGSSASPIQESNVGNILLRKMGWTPGSTLGTLGSSEGLRDPLTATIRKKNAGLGMDD